MPDEVGPDEISQRRHLGLTNAERERRNALKRENRELRRANAILREAAAHFAQAEVNRPLDL